MKNSKKFFFGCVCIIVSQIAAGQSNPINLYFLPGLGSTQALFDSLLTDSVYERHYIDYHAPDKGTTMQEYGWSLLDQIDTTEPFVLIGTSLGGMLATELADVVSPEQVIIIASAKTVNELPVRYRFQKHFPVQKIVGPNAIKWSTWILQPLVEPDSRKELGFYRAMLHAKDAKFMKRATDMILGWNRTTHDSTIFHIHGNKDRTLPLKNIRADVVIENGSHMMTRANTKEIEVIIESILFSE